MKKSALLVAVDKYQRDLIHEELAYCVDDATALGEALAECGFQVDILVNEAATAERIIEEILARRTYQQDVFILGMFMHGAYASKNSDVERYFVPHDGNELRYLSRLQVLKALDGFRSKLSIGVFDVCRVEGRSEPISLGDVPELDWGLRTRLALSDGSRGVEWNPIPGHTYVWDACGEHERAYESHELRHGYFTHYLVEAIRTREVPEGERLLSGWTEQGLDLNAVAPKLSIKVRQHATRDRRSQTPVFSSYDQGYNAAPIIIATVGDEPAQRPKVLRATPFSFGGERHGPQGKPTDGPPAVPAPPAQGTATGDEVNEVEEVAPAVPEQDPLLEPVTTAARETPSAQPWLGVVLGIAVFVVLLSTGLYLWTAQGGPGTATCGATHAAQGLVVLLDNRQGQLTEDMRKGITERLRALRGRVAAGALVELRRVDPASDDGRLLYSTCKPDGGAGEASTRFETEWDGALAAALKDAQALPATADAPLVATMRRVALDRFGSGLDRTRWLVLVSDLREHTALFSLRGGEPDFDAFRRSPLPGRFPADLSNVELSLLQIDVGSSDGLKSLQNFWNTWMTMAGVPLDSPIWAFDPILRKQQ